MTLPNDNIGSNTLNLEVTYFSNRSLTYGTPTRMPHIIELEGPDTLQFLNLKGKKAAYNIRVQGYLDTGGFNSTPYVRVSELFPYMTGDDWFSVDVAFTENGLIPHQVWRVFFQYANDPPAQSDKYPDGYNAGTYTDQNMFQEYVWQASTDYRNFEFIVRYNSASQDVWAFCRPTNDESVYDDINGSKVRVIIRRIQYWPEGTETLEQDFPVSNWNTNVTYGESLETLQNAGISNTVINLYQTYLNRNGDLVGSTYWEGELSSGRLTLTQVIDGFVRSIEYTNRILTNEIRRVRVRSLLSDYDELYPGPFDDVPTHVNDNEANWCLSNYGVAPNDPATVENPDELACPPNPDGPGGCFTGSSLVLMANGDIKKIADVQIGELVFNHNKTSFNRVRMVEKGIWNEQLYSPSEDLMPFACINHPMYIDGRLKSVDPKLNRFFYPWLKIEETFNPSKIISVKNQQVYNLLVDGDGTYMVNNYGTHSIYGDGGALVLYIEQGLITAEELQFVNEDYWSNFIDDPNNVNTIHDIQVLVFNINKFLGNIKIKTLNKYIVKWFIKSQKNKFEGKWKFKALTLISKTLRLLKCIKR